MNPEIVKFVGALAECFQCQMTEAFLRSYVMMLDKYNINYNDLFQEALKEFDKMPTVKDLIYCKTLKSECPQYRYELYPVKFDLIDLPENKNALVLI